MTGDDLDGGKTPRRLEAAVQKSDGGQLKHGGDPLVGVKVGLIGAGAMGRRHLIDLSRDARVTLVGVADVVEEAARTAADEVGARSCGDLAALAECGAEAVFVTLPNVHHGPVGDHALLASEDLDRVRLTTRDTPDAKWRHLPAPDALTLWGYVDEDRAFIDACLGQAPPPVDVDDAFCSLAVLDAAYASLRQGGRPVAVPET